MKTKHIILASLIILIGINFSCQKHDISEIAMDKIIHGILHELSITNLIRSPIS